MNLFSFFAKIFVWVLRRDGIFFSNAIHFSEQCLQVMLFIGCRIFLFRLQLLVSFVEVFLLVAG